MFTSESLDTQNKPFHSNPLCNKAAENSGWIRKSFTCKHHRFRKLLMKMCDSDRFNYMAVCSEALPWCSNQDTFSLLLVLCSPVKICAIPCQSWFDSCGCRSWERSHSHLGFVCPEKNNSVRNNKNYHFGVVCLRAQVWCQQISWVIVFTSDIGAKWCGPEHKVCL